MAESVPLLNGAMEAPPSTFTFARNGPQGRRPQAIAHRGYKATNPENTMSAFRAAVDVGAHGIETDLRLSKDGVVVLSHDATLKRCFGRDEKIAECNWDYMRQLRTLKQPHQPMARLKDLLEYLATPGLEHVWILLDVKVLVPSLTEALTGNKAIQTKFDDYADNLYRLIADTLAGVKSPRPWNERVLVGCWAVRFPVSSTLSPEAHTFETNRENTFPSAKKYLPDYPVTHIGFSVDYARQFLKVPGVNITMLQELIIGPRGNAFLQEVKRKKADRSILLWTVNEESWMKWCIRLEADAVITDDPKKYLEVCKSYDKDEKLRHSWKSWKFIFRMHMRALLFGLSFRYRHGFWVDVSKVMNNSES